MPFLRFSRDKRGYEHFYLMQPSPARHGKVPPRILYWFRTPPNVKLGREPFADHVRRGLEAQNPDVRFDWDAIVATPIPPPDAEHWRERRRAERAAKQAAKAESSAVEEAEAAERAGGVEGAGGVEEGREPLAVSAPATPETVPSTQELQTTPDTLSLSRRRRRRRGRRRAQRPGNEVAPAVAPAVDKHEGEN